MSRYIDADALWNDRPQLIGAESIGYKAGFYDCMRGFCECIHKQISHLTADVVEVRHAEWKYGKENGQYGYYCTICKAGFVGVNAEWIAKEHNFCPKCGAKMDGERKDENEG